ncbi:hypothetical protein ACFX13_044610 [Malus domestica]
MERVPPNQMFGNFLKKLMNTSIEEIKKAEQAKRLEKEEHELTAVLKGPNHAFGELIAASAITDEML